MTFEEARRALTGIPYITPANAAYLYRLIREREIRDILELGIGHGTATCYMAAALRAAGSEGATGGRIDAVDLEEKRDFFDPSAEALVARLGLADLVRVHRMQSGYTWFLHDRIAERTTGGQCSPCYDLCLIDGPKNWTIDGAAFFMADKLLRPGGWMIFDDYGWTHAPAAAKGRSVTDGISHRSLSEAELTTPQIREVFELLVKPHPGYSDFTILDGDWAIARKIASDHKETVFVERHEIEVRGFAARVLHRARRVFGAGRGRG